MVVAYEISEQCKPEGLPECEHFDEVGFTVVFETGWGQSLKQGFITRCGRVESGATLQRLRHELNPRHRVQAIGGKFYGVFV